MNVADQLGAIQASYQTGLDGLAAHVRQALVLPACRRYRLAFFGSNPGGYCFKSVDGDDLFYDQGDVAKIGRPDDLVRVFAELSLRVREGVYLGDLVRDVREADWVDPPTHLDRDLQALEAHLRDDEAVLARYRAKRDALRSQYDALRRALIYARIPIESGAGLGLDLRDRACLDARNTTGRCVALVYGQGPRQPCYFCRREV